MNFFRSIALAYYNLVHKVKFSVKMISSITLIFIIMVYSSLFIEGIEKYYEKLVVDNARENNIYIDLNVSQAGTILKDDLELLEEIQALSGIGEPIVYAGVDMTKVAGNESEFYVSSEHVSIIQEDSQITMPNIESGIFDVCYLGKSGSLFTDNDKESFSYYFPDESLFLAGKDFQEYGDIIVSNDFLTQFGIEDYSECINKHFSILVDGKSYLQNVRLVGVYNSKISEIDMIKNYSPVIYCGEQNDISIFQIEKLSVCIPVKDFESSENISSALEELERNQNVFFDESNAQILVYVNRIKQLVYYIIFLVMGFVIVAMFLSLCGVLYNRIRENTSYYAMMRAVGLKEFSLLGLLQIEQLLLLLVSAFFALPFSSFGLYLVNYLLRDILQVDIRVSFFEFVKTGTVCILIIYIALIVATAVFLIWNQKKQISELLKT